MTLKKNDFIEIDFTAKTSDGEVFDSTDKSELEKIGSQAPAKPFVFALGQDMFLKSVDEFLTGKDIGKYKVELEAGKAFGLRQPDLVQLMPAAVFKEHKLNPFPGASFNFDGRVGKVLSVSGGRIRIDFNNPIAGKDVVYELEVKRKIEDQKEKVESFMEFLFRRPLKFEIKDKKIIITLSKEEAQMKQFVEMFEDKFKEVFKMGVEVKVPEVKEDIKPKTTEQSQ